MEWATEVFDVVETLPSIDVRPVHVVLVHLGSGLNCEIFAGSRTKIITARHITFRFILIVENRGL